MTRIGVLADIHANYPATKAAVERCKKLECDQIYHLGDAIAIGPYPRETVELLQEHDVILIMGNHEEYFARGLSRPQPDYMSDGEYYHQEWTHSILGSTLKKLFAGLPYQIDLVIEGVKIILMHCPYSKSEKYSLFLDLRKSHREDLDRTFDGIDCDIVCYGHTHFTSDVEGSKRYINPGSVGCNAGPFARFVVMEIRNGAYDVLHCQVRYDKQSLLQTMKTRNVPDRDFICRAFYGEMAL